MIRTARLVTRRGSPCQFGLVVFRSSVSMSAVNSMPSIIPDSHSTSLLRATPPPNQAMQRTAGRSAF